MDGWRASSGSLIRHPIVEQDLFRHCCNVAKVHRNPRSVTQIQALQPRATNTVILRPCSHKPFPQTNFWILRFDFQPQPS